MSEGDINNDNAKNPRKVRTVKILIVIGLVLLMTGVIMYFIPTIPYYVGLIIFFLILLDIALLVMFSTQSYNIGIAFIVMIICAIYSRKMRWPTTGVLFTLGFSGLSVYSYFLARIFLVRFKHNTFLRYIGFSSSVILSLASLGLLWKNMHWELAGLILNTGLFLYIPFLFAFVFSLPSSNYISWNKSERIAFFRAIVIPMAFVYVLVVLMIVFPEIYTAMTRNPLIPFDMIKVELLNKPGLY